MTSFAQDAKVKKYRKISEVAEGGKKIRKAYHIYQI